MNWWKSAASDKLLYGCTLKLLYSSDEGIKSRNILEIIISWKLQANMDWIDKLRHHHFLQVVSVCLVHHDSCLGLVWHSSGGFRLPSVCKASTKHMSNNCQALAKKHQVNRNHLTEVVVWYRRLCQKTFPVWQISIKENIDWLGQNFFEAYWP